MREREEVSRDLQNAAVQARQLPDRIRQRKKKAIALYRQFCKEGKEKQAIQAAELLRKSNEFLQEVEAHFRKVGGIKRVEAVRNQWQEFCDSAKLAFDIEQRQAEKTRDTKALEGLRYLKKTANRGMNNGQKRVFGILKMLRDKTSKAAGFKDGSIGFYTEGALGGDRLLSDEFWQGRFTVMEFRSGLEDMYAPRVAGDKEGKKVRRTLKGLGIQPAEDQVGRKWKGPNLAKQEPKRRGRQGARPPEIVRTGKIDDVLRADSGHRVNTRGHVLKKEYGKFNAGNTSYGGLSSWVTSARKDLAAIDREILKLTLLRGGRKGKFVY